MKQCAGCSKKRAQAVAQEAVVSPDLSAEFVAAMEDILELYAEPYNPKRPTVNFDEASKQLFAKTRTPLPARLGQRALRL
jgi:hypothetical protein